MFIDNKFNQSVTWNIEDWPARIKLSRHPGWYMIKCFGLIKEDQKIEKINKHIGMMIRKYNGCTSGAGWFIITEGLRADYLHKDGSIHGSTQVGNVWSGYFDSKKDAEDCVNKFGYVLVEK